jgi:hypothetical protein
MLYKINYGFPYTSRRYVAIHVALTAQVPNRDCRTIGNWSHNTRCHLSHRVTFKIFNTASQARHYLRSLSLSTPTPLQTRLANGDQVELAVSHHLQILAPILFYSGLLRMSVIISTTGIPQSNSRLSPNKIFLMRHCRPTRRLSQPSKILSLLEVPRWDELQ